MKDSMSHQREEGGDEMLHLARVNKEKARSAHQLFINRERRERARKMDEVQTMKHKLDNSIRATKELMMQERDLIRHHVQSLRTLRLHSSIDYLAAESSAEAATSHDADQSKPAQRPLSSTANSVSSTSSFVVNIPWELTDKVKHAKRCVPSVSCSPCPGLGPFASLTICLSCLQFSLSAYTAARKEVKDYQEQIYAEKLRAIAIQKHVAQKRAKSMGSPLRLNLLKASELFCDSQNSSGRMLNFDDTIASEDDSSLQLSIK